MFLSWADQLGSNQLVTSLLKSGHDVANESSLDAIWLDCDETVQYLLETEFDYIHISR